MGGLTPDLLCLVEARISLATQSGLQKMSSGASWELVRNADSQAPATESGSAFSQAPRGFTGLLGLENHWSKGCGTLQSRGALRQVRPARSASLTPTVRMGDALDPAEEASAAGPQLEEAVGSAGRPGSGASPGSGSTSAPFGAPVSSSAGAVLLPIPEGCHESQTGHCAENIHSAEASPLLLI